jgi:hypothetical protein
MAGRDGGFNMSEPEQSDRAVPFVPWATLWLLAGVVAWILIFRDVTRPDPRHVTGRDFSNLWMAGKLALSGQSACIFDPNCFRANLVEVLGLTAKQNYSYPPHALFVGIPFALLPYYVALGVWTAAGVLFFNACAKPYLPERFPPYLAAFTTAGWLTIWNGHYAFLLGGLWLLFFRWIEQRPLRAGVVAGFLTFKPHMGLMIAATALKRPVAVGIAVATTAGLVIASAIIFGAHRWSDFLVSTTATQGEILSRVHPELYFRMMPSAYVAFGRGMPGVVAQMTSAIAAIALLWRSRRWDAFSAATATFLIVPYVFNYDMTVACLGYAIYLHHHWHRLRLYERAGLFFAFLSPELTFYVPHLVPFGLLYALKVQLQLGGESIESRPRQSAMEPLRVALD